MAYYDRIAKQWHKATGYRGGAFKELVLNDVLLSKLPDIHNRSILELGAGNGYFLPLVLRRFSGQVPAAIVITDQSTRLLGMAENYLRIPHATYQRLDVRQPFPFDDGSFDVVLASMVFNEVSSRGMSKGLAECYRVLVSDGLLLIAVIHPDFVDSLRRRGLLGRTKSGVLTMPGAGNLRLPVVTRSSEGYRGMLRESGFRFGEEEVFPNAEVLSAKPGLRNAGGVALALVFECTKSP
jgi:SAM-dependent methyltransferase